MGVDLVERVDRLNKIMAEYERMKNCTNCDHKEVCITVHFRKVNKANDYSPCEHWKIGACK